MYIFGIIMVVVGAILYFGSRLMVSKTKAKMIELKDSDSTSDDDFLALLSNSVIVTKIMGVLLVVAGAIFIFFL